MRVLLVVHGFPPHGLGGTEIYAEAHARTLATGHGDTVLVLARENDPTRPEFGVRHEAREQFRIAWVNHTFRESTSLEDAWRAPRVARAVAPVIETFAPDVAHVHHLTCLSTLIPSLLAARLVPLIVTLHDYWLMCHRGQLLDLDGRPCDGPGEAGCARCFPPETAIRGTAGRRAVRAVDLLAPRVGALLRNAARSTLRSFGPADGARDAVVERTRHVRDDVLPHVDVFFAPSKHVRDRFIRFGAAPDRIRVLPNAVPGATEADAAAARASQARAPLRIGYVGSLIASKAPHVVMQAVARLPAGSVELDVFGAYAPYHGDESYRQVLDLHASHPSIRVHGPLPHSEVAAALRSIDVLVVPSVWEETSSLIALEALQAGVPVVASRLGGIPEIVADGQNGLLVEPGDSAALATALQRLADDPTLIGRLRDGIRPVPSMSDAVGRMRQEYERLCHGQPSARGTTRHVVAVVLHYATPADTALGVRALRASDAPLQRVIVVDNDDHPGDLDLGVAGLPVDRLVMGANRGFAAGMNAGIRAALAQGAGAVLLVNNDAIVPPGAAAALTGALEAHPRAGIVAPVVLARERPGTIASLGIRFDRVTGRMRNIGVGERFDRAHEMGWRPVDSVNGAVMLVTREVLERVGVFDEAYFFGFEEIDLCLRARDAGFEPGVTAAAVVYHQGGGTLPASSPQRFYFAARNHLRVAARAGRPSNPAARAARTMAVAALNSAHALTAAGGHRAARLAATWRGTRDYVRGRFGPDPRAGAPDAPP